MPDLRCDGLKPSTSVKQWRQGDSVTVPGVAIVVVDVVVVGVADDANDVFAQRCVFLYVVGVL